MNITKKYFWLASFIYSLISSIARPDVPNTFDTMIGATIGAWILYGGIVYVLTHLGKNKNDPSRDTIAFWVSTVLFLLTALGNISKRMAESNIKVSDTQGNILGYFFLLSMVLVAIKIINGKTPIEHKEGKMGICSICGKPFGTDWPAWKKALMWWFASKEHTMTCLECRQERAKRRKTFKKELTSALENEFLDKGQEKQLLQALAEVHLCQLVEDSQKDLDYVRRLTGYKTGELVGITVSDIALKEGEKLLFTTPVSLHQVRSQTRYKGRSEGLTFRIAKGVSYRTGVFQGEPIREQYLNLEGYGTLYVTDKRVIFNGCRNITHKWGDVLQVISFPPDGVSFSVENKATFHLMKVKSSDPREIKELLVCCEAVLGSKVKE